VALPRDSLNGKVRTGMASLRFVSRPLPKLDLAFGYRWNERDNDTPVDVYQRVLNDAGDATDPDQDFENAHINRPYGHDKHKVDVDVSYRLPLRSKVTLSYDFEQIRRHLEEVDQSDEHGFGVKLITRPFNRVSIGIRAQRSYRDEDHYDCVEPLVQTEPPSLLGDPGCEFGQDFENHPDLRKYNQTDRRRWDTHLWANIAPLDDVNLGFKVRYVDDDYFNSELGLVDQRYFSTGMDASWTPTDRLLFHLFYDYEERRSKQDSLSWSPFSSPTNLSNGWSTRDTDRFHTTGLGFEFTVIPERVTLGAEYLFARSREILDTRVNTFREDRPFPDATTELHDVSLRSELHLTENFSLRVGYLYERFKSRDWQIDEVCPACLAADGDEAAVLALGEESPDYSAHVGTVSLIFRFR
jgi:MtrB/PioB family decaheme-associated outer membrane protein